MLRYWIDFKKRIFTMTSVNNNRGFTIVELMIVVVLSSIVTAAIIMVYQAQNRSYLFQERITQIQQNLRAATFVMSDEIRMVGTSIISAGDGTAGNPFQFTAVADSDDQDNDNDGTVDEAGEIKNVRYRLFDDQADSDMELGRQEIGSGRPEGAIAENIQNIGFAYAYDSDDDSDNEADTYTDTTGTERIIWAIPGAGNRWRNLDLNEDGVIDDNDSPNPGVRVGNTLAGGPTGVSVDLERIRGIRIWMLAASDPLDADNASRFYSNNIYIIGNQKIVTNDSLIRKVLSTSTKFRNMGM
jgi:type IV pilus assembly protein PilW